MTEEAKIDTILDMFAPSPMSEMKRGESHVGSRRERLLAAGREFAVSAVRCDGMRRIALIGSLCTAKSYPKDIDLLIDVEAGLDLTQLAKLARHLCGTVCQIPGGTGADVFVVENNQYRGRLCSYREPWRRRVCANSLLNCVGDRLFLCDTGRNFSLTRRLILNPPLILWPHVVINSTPIPDDVRACFGLEGLARDDSRRQNPQRVGPA